MICNFRTFLNADAGMDLVSTSNISAEGIIPVGLSVGDFPLKPDNLRYNCTLPFRGNRTPRVRWKCGEDIIASDTSSPSVVANSVATYSLAMQATQSMTDKDLVCETDFFEKQILATSENDRLKRSLPVGKILRKRLSFPRTIFQFADIYATQRLIEALSFVRR